MGVSRADAPDAEIPPSVRQWLRDRAADVVSVERRASSQGEVCVVRTTRERFVVKQASRAAIERERRGLEAARVRGVPAILAAPAPTVLVLSWHPGRPSEAPEAVHAAGRWLRGLHEQGTAEPDSLPVQDALMRRRDAWLGRAVGLEVRAVEDATFEAFRGAGRVLCHRDFTPSNWLWDADGGLTVIDFGQSRADLAQWDLVKLEGELFARKPSLREPFYEGYGSVDRTGLSDLLLLHGLQTAAWGDAHGNQEFSALGRRLLGEAPEPGG